jgi:hypothetical protein
MSESTTLIAPATAWKTPVEPLFEPIRLGRYDLPHRKGLALELVVQGGLLCLRGLSSWLDLSILYINAQTGIP